MELTPKLKMILLELKTIGIVYPDENLRDALSFICSELEETIRNGCEYHVYIDSINKDELKEILENIKEESTQDYFDIIVKYQDEKDIGRKYHWNTY